MDIKKVEELIQLFESSSLTELKIKDKKQSITLSRAVTNLDTPVVHSTEYLVTTPAEEEEGVETVIMAPMVGTFYSAATPESSPFVMVGDYVTMDTTVCVLEAMKVFTEIPADVDGVVTEVLVANGEFVEYGQPLFKVKVN